MRKRTSKLMMAGLLCVSMLSSTVVFAKPGVAYNATTHFQHGSSTPVSESQLKTSIPAGYDVNQSTQVSAKKGQYARLFEEDCVKELNITVDDNNWNYLLQHANKEPYVMADRVSIGDDSVDYVGLKTKGNYTLLTAWQSDTDRFSFAINVGKYIKKDKGYSDTQNFYGLKKFSLNNVTGDATYLKEYLAYKMFRELGIPAPQCALVKLCINGRYWGVYSMIENIDTPMYKRATSFSDVDLYKPEKQGGSLVYSSKFDPYLDGSADFDLSTYDRQGNVLADYVGLWDNQVTGTTIEDYQEAVSSARTDEEKAKAKKTGEKVKKSMKNLLSWMKKLDVLNKQTNADSASYETACEEILDVDAVLKYFAANTYIAMLDGYQADEAHNFAIGYHDGKVFALPWDYNYSFGAFNLSSTSDYINFNIDKPVVKVNMSDRPLLNVLLKNKNYRKRYEQFLLDCCKIACAGGTITGTDLAGRAYSHTYKPYYFKSIIENFQKGQLGEALRQNAEEKPFYSYDQYMNSCTPFINLINQRTVAVINQVYDKFDKVADLGINMSSMGFSHSWGWPGGWGWPGSGGNNTQQGTEPWPIPEIKPYDTQQTIPSAIPSAVPSMAPSAKPSPTPSVKPSPTPLPSVKPTPIIKPSEGTGVSKVKVSLSNQTAEGSNTIGGSITLQTTDDDALDLSKIKVKYYFTAESSGNHNVWIDSASMQYQRDPWYAAVTSDTSALIKEVNTGSAEANRCMEVSFSSTEKIEQGASLTISFRLANENWSSFNQSNDYSYGNPDHIVIVYEGNVVSGMEP